MRSTYTFHDKIALLTKGLFNTTIANAASSVVPFFFHAGRQGGQGVGDALPHVQIYDPATGKCIPICASLPQ